MAASLRGKNQPVEQRGIICRSCNQPIVGEKVTAHWSRVHNGAFRKMQTPLGDGNAV